jgi:hypothetical protein
MLEKEKRTYMKMKKEKEKLNGQENVEEVLEFLKNARMLKKQIRLIRGIELTDREEEVVKEVLGELKKEFTLFKI